MAIFPTPFTQSKATLTLDGFEVSLFRDETGTITVAIDTEADDTRDLWGTGIPKIRLCVNEGNEMLNREGEWHQQ